MHVITRLFALNTAYSCNASATSAWTLLPFIHGHPWGLNKSIYVNMYDFADYAGVAELLGVPVPYDDAISQTYRTRSILLISYYRTYAVSITIEYSLY